MKKIVTLSSFLLLVMLFQFCTKTDSPSVSNTTITSVTPIRTFTTYNYLDTYPAHIQEALSASDNTPSTNPITNDGANLGRILFYDKQLSRNGTTSCGSCHQQKNSFSDSLALSKGLDGAFTTRHSMALLNIRFYKSGKMFWDEKAASIEKQALQPIINHIINLYRVYLLDA
jgi:cytochrome c peroxidase